MFSSVVRRDCVFLKMVASISLVILLILTYDYLLWKARGKIAVLMGRQHALHQGSNQSHYMAVNVCETGLGVLFCQPSESFG